MHSGRLRTVKVRLERDSARERRGEARRPRRGEERSDE